VTVGLQVSVLAYLPERSSDEANWQLPISLERIPTSATPCEIAQHQLKLLAESIHGTVFSVIVADSA
jgi:hypothetical protein